MFIDIQQRELQKLGLGSEWLLGQGTIYPDTIESGGTANSQVIKTHHNRVERIQEMLAQGLVVEPLADLYKDEVRELGEILGLPRDLVWRHPFPGPGLAIRILCNDQPAQSFQELQKGVNILLQDYALDVVVLPLKSVGVQGDARTYAHPVLLVGNADWDILETVSTMITNTFPEINRVLYQVATWKTWTTPFLGSGTLTIDRIERLQTADHITTRMLKSSGLYDKVWQCPMVLIPCAPVQGTESIVLRPVDSTEAMTANFSRLHWEKVVNIGMTLLSPTITSVLYDITNKPPGTIEWE